MSVRRAKVPDKIYFKTKDIQDYFDRTGTYIKDSFVIKSLPDFDQYKEEQVPQKEDYNFALQNRDDNIPFLGVVNFYFKREGYCFDTYTNGDHYFGYYSNDLRNKQGIYSYKPKIIDNNLLSEFYYGQWENNLFNGKGIYLWLKEKEEATPFSDYKSAKITSFVGYSNEGKFKKGALLNKEGDNFFIYYGSFNEDGQKDGENCFYYCSNLDKIIYGTYRNGVFIEGYVAKFKNDGRVTQLIVYKKEENKDPEGERIRPKFEKKIIDILSKFREAIKEKDYFKMIYEEFGRILKFRDENMKDIEIFLSEKYADIKKCFDFNKISICEDIEKKIYS
jgi:hypothetical protein